jgi:hypothetical protein
LLAKIKAINTYHIEQFAYLIGKLKSIPEGEGTLLDIAATFGGVLGLDVGRKQGKHHEAERAQGSAQNVEQRHIEDVDFAVAGFHAQPAYSRLIRLRSV